MINSFRFKKLDAFANNGSSGNPAGVVYLQKETDLSPAKMQQIAKELKGFVNEVAFLFQAENKDADYLLKYYSSEREVDFCGHATIALFYDLIKTTPELLVKPVLKIKTNMGMSDIYVEILKEDAIFLSAPAPQYLKTNLTLGQVAQALEIPEKDIDLSRPIALVNGGLKTLIVAIRDLEACLKVLPDEEKLKYFCLDNNIDVVHISTGERYDPSNAYRSRVFAPTFGYLEDPATGSANAAFGYYLLQNNLWDGNLISLEQGLNKEKANIIKLSTILDENKIQRVLIGGNAIVKIDGEYFL